MSNADAFDRGIERARSDIAVLESRLNAVSGWFKRAQEAMMECREREGRLSVVVSDLSATVNLGDREEVIARVEYDPVTGQLLYSDWRLGSKYPLPVNLTSIDVFVGYVGLSIGWLDASDLVLKLDVDRAMRVRPLNGEQANDR